MAEKQKRAGALQSELHIELHTNYAIGLWEGRKAEKREDGKKGKQPIMGMPQFLYRATLINKDSLQNDPWADMTMLALEEKINLAGKEMNMLIETLDKQMSFVPAGVTISDAHASEPLDLTVFSGTPLGYRCVFLLMGFDQFAKKVLQAAHYGVISRTQRYELLGNGSRLLREIYGCVLQYRKTGATRLDAVENNEVWQKACQEAGEPDRAVLLGEKRSAFSPPVNEASVNLLRLRYQAI
ncbi:TIGR03761 family integrating conjugative element protein [Salmonella enterica subsp. enterica serovar Typhimurium]|uniref:PFL_4669 family integrating conjugative element protein n=1 Tax=Kosakonia radicincitans TaxID=283686 RepID=UPI00090412BE|nr:TIGR03761 family integrating conjugative element protein [Kosakonia radicincitans]EBU5081912.1 TIGR03761 family integrating conjugative element protein [Salmonella enterica]ECC3308675.1 TIGR03761 family integrating conjugative element protein [Salmonella enterica subsp. enterica]EEJ9202683.1 TIGR03761 family integrating conjugative element protein [Salmonella enterica subsp. enterica serovar Newport]EIE3222481.1 TIGR03761 family integrating conjugative element protein [Salmonella enterica su